MSSMDFGVTLDPESQALESLGNSHITPNAPRPAGADATSPAPASATESPAGAVPAAPVSDEMAPVGDFARMAPVLPEPTSADRLVNTVRAAVREELQSEGATTPAADPVLAGLEKMRTLASADDASDEFKTVVDVAASLYDTVQKLEQRNTALEAQANQRATAEQEAAKATVLAALDAADSKLMTDYKLTPGHLEQMYQAWDQASQGANGAAWASLTPIEFARRYWGEDQLEARRGVRAPAPANGQRPAAPQPGAHQPGHLVSDASNGAAPSTGPRWVPPQRDRGGVTLDDARRGAQADPRFQGR